MGNKVSRVSILGTMSTIVDIIGVSSAREWEGKSLISGEHR